MEKWIKETQPYKVNGWDLYFQTKEERNKAYDLLTKRNIKTTPLQVCQEWSYKEKKLIKLDYYGLHIHNSKKHPSRLHKQRDLILD